MLPYLIIFTFVIIGALIGGVTGFFIWIVLGFIAIIVISRSLSFLSGGLLPRKIRNETVDDFIAEYADIVQRAYQTDTLNETKQQIATLLEAFYKRAVKNNPSFNSSANIDSQVLISSALQVAEEQPTDALKELAVELALFLKVHKHWYG